MENVPGVLLVPSACVAYMYIDFVLYFFFYSYIS